MECTTVSQLQCTSLFAKTSVINGYLVACCVVVVPRELPDMKDSCGHEQADTDI
jgi:hypothetical protein